jgi:translation initiation factor 3 subunit M
VLIIGSSEQIQELVNYIVRNRSEDERAALIRPFQDALKTEEGKQPLSEDEDRRRKIFSMVLAHVKGLGDGSEKGVSMPSPGFTMRRLTKLCAEIEGFFNLLYSHLLSLYPADSPERNGFLRELLQTLSSSPSENSAVKYRM